MGKGHNSQKDPYNVWLGYKTAELLVRRPSLAIRTYFPERCRTRTATPIPALTMLGGSIFPRRAMS